MRVNFKEISLVATKRWKDKSGKRRQKTQKFWQTVNPLNRNDDGSIRTEAEIMTELKAERDAWMAKTVEEDEFNA